MVNSSNSSMRCNRKIKIFLEFFEGKCDEIQAIQNLKHVRIRKAKQMVNCLLIDIKIGRLDQIKVSVLGKCDGNIIRKETFFCSSATVHQFFPTLIPCLIQADPHLQSPGRCQIQVGNIALFVLCIGSLEALGCTGLLVGTECTCMLMLLFCFM